MDNLFIEKEVELLKKLSNKHHYSDIAKIMNKTENDIYMFAKKHNIPIIKHERKWTKEEESKLIDLWGNVDIINISKELNKPIFSIKIKVSKMGLDAIMIDNHDLLSISDISDLFNVPRKRIINNWKNLGLKINMKGINSHYSYYVIKWEDLIKFLENNQNEWDSNDLKENVIGIEPDWLFIKRQKDKKENPLWHRVWIEEDIVEIYNLFKRGKNYEEISLLTDRNFEMIKHLLKNSGYILKEYLTEKEIEYKIEMYVDMTPNY